MQDYEKYLNDRERQGIHRFVEMARQLMGQSLIDIRIFGSKVRGDFDKESDIDILLVIDSDDWHIRNEISKIAADANMEFDCNISPVIYTKREHEKNKYFRTLFIQEVEREGVSLA
ncbi:MAG: hypothetical protein A2056_01405 [Deltaproteobacteria bacterium GWA2_42_85]|nr:MAG: hypothetical protein A2056_01405 [Deltaproteobacteria bacterium GWA2_42_85]